MTVRPATPADATALAHLQADAWRAGFDGLMPAAALAQLDQLDPAPRVARWEQLLGDAETPAQVLVSEDAQGVPSGFCVFGPTRDRDAGSDIYEIVQIGVAAQQARQGHGRALLDAVKAKARAAGVSELNVWVVKSNPVANQFFAALAFKPDGTQRLDLRVTNMPLTEGRQRCPVVEASV